LDAKTTNGDFSMADTHLNDEQRAQFEREGYLVIPAVFDGGEVARMQREADRILELLINSSLALGRVSGRLDWLERENGLPTVRKVQPINDLSEVFAQVADDARLLDPMRDIMGDEPVLMEEKLNYKQPLSQAIEGIEFPARTDDSFPIHNDWAYYKAQNYPQEIVSSAISLDECTPENGPLRVWPGTHKQHREHAPDARGSLEVLPHLIDSEGGQDVLAPPGSVMFFHALLAHNSRPNQTDEPRRLMIYSHYPARYDLGHDVRNGPVRERERPFEQQYLQMRERGEFADRITLP
jgi:ectoine hydroxylase-related dioxygenase (phytanoyl-CoA dioxygenase family)